MERKGSFTALLITALFVLVSALQREYFLVTEPASWNDAQQYCRSHHTDLAFIHTKEEANNVSALGLWGNHNCVALQNNVAFNYKCDTKHSFFCYESDLVLVKENKTWEEALEYCRDQDSDLPSLLSEAEQSSAKKTTSEAQTSQVWTGLRFLAGQWLWVNGDGLEFQDWPAGEMPFCPARYLHCGTLDKEEEHWGTRDCKEKLNFLCVKKWSD